MSEQGRSGCDGVLRHLFAYLDRELSDAEVLRVREHLAECPSCLAEIAVEEHLRLAVKRSCCEKAPEELRIRIQARLTTYRPELPA